MAPKSTFIIIGMIMSQINAAIGRFTRLPVPNSIPRNSRTSEGVRLPIASPVAMHSPTQTVR